MPEIKGYSQGMPCWVELATTDEKGALKFYGALFGWKDNPQPMGPGVFYHMQRVCGLDAAAIYQLGEPELKQRMPSHWRTYIAVRDVDAAAKKVQQAGGKVLMEPMDVFTAGRMAMVQDPQGAMFALWQAKEHIGCRVMNEPGAVSWVELLTTDAKKAAGFYTGVMGIESQVMSMPAEYTLLKVGGREVAGIMGITREMGPIPPNWSVYFGAADVDASVKKAESLGAKTLKKPMDIPSVGRWATLMDPQGAVFSLFKGG